MHRARPSVRRPAAPSSTSSSDHRAASAVHAPTGARPLPARWPWRLINYVGEQALLAPSRAVRSRHTAAAARQPQPEPQPGRCWQSTSSTGAVALNQSGEGVGRVVLPALFAGVADSLRKLVRLWPAPAGRRRREPARHHRHRQPEYPRPSFLRPTSAERQHQRHASHNAVAQPLLVQIQPVDCSLHLRCVVLLDRVLL